MWVPPGAVPRMVERADLRSPPCSRVARRGRRQLGGAALFAQALERGEALAQRLHGGDFFAEAAAGHVAAPLGLGLQDVGDVRVDGFRLFHAVDHNLHGSAMPARLQKASQASRSKGSPD